MFMHYSHALRTFSHAALATFTGVVGTCEAVGLVMSFEREGLSGGEPWAPRTVRSSTGTHSHARSVCFMLMARRRRR
jgi:hypothetical protein